jgi:uncharacterized tellurite resistance protein B-like protein
MKEYTLTEKYAIINILSAIMEADTIIHPKEIEYMNNIMQRLQIVVSDLDHMEIRDFALEKQVIKSMDIEKQQEAIALFHEMAEIDGFVDPRELELISSI